MDKGQKYARVDADIMLVEAMTCLAMNVYHEARDQSLIGQVAVAQVVMNRNNMTLCVCLNR